MPESPAIIEEPAAPPARWQGVLVGSLYLAIGCLACFGWVLDDARVPLERQLLLAPMYAAIGAVVSWFGAACIASALFPSARRALERVEKDGIVRLRPRSEGPAVAGLVAVAGAGYLWMFVAMPLSAILDDERVARFL